MHKKICPRGNAVAQSLTFALPAPEEGFPEVPVRAVRRMDGYGQSGMTLLFSDHLGIEKLMPYAARQFPCDCDDEDETRDTAKWMGGGNAAYEPHVTSPVSPDIMMLKPGEAAFNTEKYPDAVRALLSNGIITDTNKKVQIGLYPEQFPICRIHAPQTDKQEEVQKQMKENEEMLTKMGFTTFRMGR